MKRFFIGGIFVLLRKYCQQSHGDDEARIDLLQGAGTRWHTLRRIQLSEHHGECAIPSRPEIRRRRWHPELLHVQLCSGRREGINECK